MLPPDWYRLKWYRVSMWSSLFVFLSLVYLLFGKTLLNQVIGSHPTGQGCREIYILAAIGICGRIFRYW
jgi:hypothetical protein